MCKHIAIKSSGVVAFGKGTVVFAGLLLLPIVRSLFPGRQGFKDAEAMAHSSAEALSCNKVGDFNGVRETKLLLQKHFWLVLLKLEVTAEVL